MTTLHIHLPDDLKDAAEHEVATGRYATVSEYVCPLIHRDQTRGDGPALEQLLRQRLESSPASAMEDTNFDAIRARVFGEFSGKVHLSDDFTAPLSGDGLAEWERSES